MELLRRLPGSEWTAASCVIRTCLVDDMLLRAIKEDKIDTVINLGAGLDTRPYRLQLEPSLRWLEVDQPAVLEYKASKLEGYPTACMLETEALDITDGAATKSLFRRIGARASHALVLTEGLLAYLTDEQVAELALGLSWEPTFCLWLSDLISPAALWLMSSVLGKSPEARDVTLRFAPEDGSAYFLKFGWTTDESRSCLTEGHQMDRWFLDRSILAQLSSVQLEVMQRLFMVVRLRRVTNTNLIYTFIG